MSSITLEDFLSNFTVRVANYTPEQETTIAVHFEVRCNVNGRLSIHTASVDVSEMQAYTTNAIIDMAWNMVKSNVSDWATTNVSNPPLSVFTPTTCTNDISLTDLNNNFTIRASRWELYPKERPETWVVGFEMSQNGGSQSKIMDCTIPIVDMCNNTLCLNIMTAGWNVMEPAFCAWAGQVLADTNVINTIYVATSLTI
jgi:hypothetical protein